MPSHRLAWTLNIRGKGNGLNLVFKKHQKRYLPSSSEVHTWFWEGLIQEFEKALRGILSGSPESLRRIFQWVVRRSRAPPAKRRIRASTLQKKAREKGASMPLGSLKKVGKNREHCWVMEDHGHKFFFADRAVFSCPFG